MITTTTEPGFELPHQTTMDLALELWHEGPFVVFTSRGFVWSRETTSKTVLGLSFHPKNPWILASLHSDGIELWDYRIKTLIHRFDEHQGPVRGVHFHNLVPLFVSGGDDHKVKVWNYNTYKSFTLLGHHGSIRTVHFNHEFPWVLSASDDHTIRMWNWQSRTCISVLSDQDDSVLCASFHPQNCLIVSASLDNTVRVWDIKQSLTSVDPDVRVKFVLQNHLRGVKWASFHHTQSLIVSGGNGCNMCLWQMGATEARLVNDWPCHMNNVASILFYPKRDNRIISLAEDKCIIVWDINTGTKLQTFYSNHDRYCTLAVHPGINLIAAGHDSGMIVFKFDRERPAFDVSGNSLFYVKDLGLRQYDFSTQTELSQAHRMKHTSDGESVGWNPSVTSLSYNPEHDAFLTTSDVNGGTYQMCMPRDVHFSGQLCGTRKISALFVSMDTFAVFDERTQKVEVKNVNGNALYSISLPYVTDDIFYAGTEKLLCRSAKKLVIFYLKKRLDLCELQTPSVVKYVAWSSDMEMVALLSKNTIIIASKELVLQCMLHETQRVKSGAWDDENGVFLYTTLNHIKYCLPNGESGIIRTLDFPMYVTKVVSGNRVFCLDRDVRIQIIDIDAGDYFFKVSLLRKHYNRGIDGSQLCGQAIVNYLRHKRLPELALAFAEDERIRFDLAIESGNMCAAIESATKINEKSQWHKLGVDALRQGDAKTAKYAHEQAENVEQLSFLHLITGDMEKLKTVDVSNNVMCQFQNALYLGDVRGRVKILEDAGKLHLAYITASVHGLRDVAERLASELGDEVPLLPEGKTPLLLLPPIPLIRGENWPVKQAAAAVDTEVDTEVDTVVDTEVDTAEQTEQ